MSERTIYEALINGGLSHTGACAIMGNMMAESAMLSDNAQNGMTPLTDGEYTYRADNDMLDFANDKVGYGLCQWTFRSRKAGLLSYCRSKGVSVSDEAAQVEFCLRELKNEYGRVYASLCQGGDLYQLTKLVCTDYERPAVNNVDTRYSFAEKFDRMFPDNSAQSVTARTGFCDPSIAVLQMVMGYNGYACNVNGVNDADFKQCLRVFCEDVIDQ